MVLTCTDLFFTTAQTVLAPQKFLACQGHRINYFEAVDISHQKLIQIQVAPALMPKLWHQLYLKLQPSTMPFNFTA